MDLGNRLTEIFNFDIEDSNRIVQRMLDDAIHEQWCSVCEYYIPLTPEEEALPGFVSVFPHCELGGLAMQHCDHFKLREEYLMEDMPINVQMHKKLCMDLNDIYTRKNHDYGDSFHDTFVEEGFAMSRIRLSDKLSRFKKLSKELEKTGSTGQQVDDESIEDTLMDLANYAIMTVVEMQRMKDQEGGKE